MTYSVVILRYFLLNNRPFLNPYLDLVALVGFDLLLFFWINDDGVSAACTESGGRRRHAPAYGDRRPWGIGHGNTRSLFPDAVPVCHCGKVKQMMTVSR
jgi:hypothetical protein